MFWQAHDWLLDEWPWDPEQLLASAPGQPLVPYPLAAQSAFPPAQHTSKDAPGGGLLPWPGHGDSTAGAAAAPGDVVTRNMVLKRGRTTPAGSDQPRAARKAGGAPAQPLRALLLCSVTGCGVELSGAYARRIR